MKWRPEQWSDEAAACLGFALGRDELEISRQVKEAEAMLWRVPGHGFVVTRVDMTDQGPELVLVAWSGVDTGPVIEYAQSVCKQNAFNSIRFHTEHPEKLATRFVSKWGFVRAETVYRWVASE